MRGRNSAHREMTDPTNLKVLGTWTPATWRGFAVEARAAEWYRLREQSLAGDSLPPWHPSRPWNADEVGLGHLLRSESPLRDLIEEGRITSGAMNGEHRRDLKETLIAGKPQSVALVGTSAPEPTEGAEAAASAPKRRGI